MTDLGRQALRSLLDDVAEASPAPGGGSSAACACALAAALVEMAARIELERGGSALPAGLPTRLRALREWALELADRELSSYEPVLAAQRLPAEDSSRASRLEEARVEASGPPLEIAVAASEVAEHGAQVAAGAAPAVRGDALAGVILAEAAAAAAAELVAINLGGRSGASGEPAAKALAARERARAARDRATGGRAE